MTTYLGIAAFVMILASLGDFFHKKHSTLPDLNRQVHSRRLAHSYFDILAVAALIIFAGLRYKVGTDYSNYVAIYQRLDTAHWYSEIVETKQEPGFTALMLTIKSVSESPQSLFWVSAVLTIVPIYAVLLRHSELPALSVALFVLLNYVNFFNGVRQGLAAAVILLAWSVMGRRRWWWFVGLVAIAATIHQSALFAGIAIFIVRRRKLNSGIIFAVFGAAILTALFVDRIPALSQVVGSVAPRYAQYIHSAETGLGAYLLVAAYALLLVFAVLIGSNKNPLNERDQRLTVLVLIAIAFMLVGTQATTVFRMSSYFTLFVLLLVPNRIASGSDRGLASTLVVAGATVFYWMNVTTYSDLFPYQTYLSQ